MHGKLLLQIFHLLFVPLNKQSGVLVNVDLSLIVDFHHSRCELECGRSFLQVQRFGPHVCDHHRLAVAAERVTQVVRQFSLSVRHMFSLFVAESKNHLFQERQRLIDVRGLLEHKTTRSSLLSALATRQVDQMQLGEHNFVGRLDTRPAFNVDCEDAVSARGIVV